MKRAFIAILMVLLLAVFLTSCGLLGKGPTNTNGENGNNDDEWQIISNATEDEVYSRLLASIKNSLEDMSDKRVSTTNNYLSVDTKFKVELNDLSLWFELKLNYDHKNPKDFLLSAEIITDSADANSVMLGIYFKDDTIYISLKDGEVGKISFPIQHQVLSSLLPIKHDSGNELVETFKVALKAMLDVKGNITGRHRMDGTQAEYEYTINIDLSNTLKNILGYLDIGENDLANFDMQLLSKIIKHIFGVTVEDLSTNGLPNSSMQLDFSTLANKLKSLKIDMGIDIDPSAQGNLIDGDSMNILLELEKLKINNGTEKKAFTSIPFFGNDNYSSFPNYAEQTFGALVNITKIGESIQENINYLLKVEGKIDLDTIENNQLLFEFLDKENNNLPISGIYIFDNVFYFYQYNEDDGYAKRLEFEVDFLEIFNMIKDGVDLDIPETTTEEDNSATALEYISYFVGAIKIADDKLTMVINEDFFSILFPGIVNFVAYAEALTGEDIQSVLDELELDLVEFLISNTFEIYIDFSESADNFIYVLNDDIDFPEGVDGRQEGSD